MNECMHGGGVDLRQVGWRNECGERTIAVEAALSLHSHVSVSWEHLGEGEAPGCCRGGCECRGSGSHHCGESCHSDTESLKGESRKEPACRYDRSSILISGERCMASGDASREDASLCRCMSDVDEWCHCLSAYLEAPRPASINIYMQYSYS